MSNLLALAFVAVVFGGSFGIWCWMRRRRERGFHAAAASFGFRALRGDSFEFPSALSLPLFEQGGLVGPIAKGHWRGMETSIFDYDVVWGYWRREHVGETVASFVHEGVNMPMFRVEPRILNDELAALFGSEVVKIANAPEFSKRYIVCSPTLPEAQAFFNALVCGCFERLPEHHFTIEGYADRIIVYVSEKILPPNQLWALVNSGGAIADSLFAAALATRTMSR